MNPVMLQEIVELIATLGPLAVKEFLQLKSILSLSSDEKQNIANGLMASDRYDDEMGAHVTAWLAAN